MRTWLTSAATVAGALLMAAGIVDYTPTWLFVAGGAVAALAGLASVGGRGAVSLVLAGAWLLAGSFVGWAVQWNALVGGLLVVSTGYLAAATGAPAAEPEPVE